MVSTRGHPKQFPEPTASPTKRSVTPSPDANNGALTAPTPRRTRSTKSSGWSHTPSNLALIWLSISLPLVIWDTGFVLLRPHTFPGGKLHWPLWVPYELYAKVDGVYGIKAWQEGLGFTAAQGTLNAIETVGYLTYLWIVWSKGQQERVEGRGAPKPSKAGWLGMARTVRGRDAGIACLLGFTFTIMTFSKTLLYCEYEAVDGDGKGKLTE